jgi:phage-related protein
MCADIFSVESGKPMVIHDYTTVGGKNLIKEYISTRPMDERREIYKIRHEIILNGLPAFQKLNTRQLRGKLYEIKYCDNRIMYVIKDGDNVYFLHACQKQKDKAEKFEIETAIGRGKELNLDL